VVQVAFILAAAALAYSFMASAQDGEMRRSCLSLCAYAPAYVGHDRLAPDIRLPDLHGKQRSLSSLQGKTVLLVFWTTTCDSCKQQMPSLAARAAMVRQDERFAMLTVAVDGSPERVREVLTQVTGHAEPFPVLLDPDAEHVMDRYGTHKFPETWVIDGEGVIRARYDGPRDWSRALVSDMLQVVADGGRCPVDIQGGRLTGRAARLCRQMAR
jgi:peroxiredoxin